VRGVTGHTFLLHEGAVNRGLGEVGNKLSVALETREVAGDESCLLGTLGNPDVEARDGAAHEEQKQQQKSEQAVPPPASPLLHLVGG